MKSAAAIFLFIVFFTNILGLNAYGQSQNAGSASGAGANAGAPGLKYIIKPAYDTVSKSNFFKRTIGFLFHKTISRIISGKNVERQTIDTTNRHSPSYVTKYSDFLVDSGTYFRNLSKISLNYLLNPVLAGLAFDSIEIQAEKVAREIILWKYHYGIDKVFIPDTNSAHNIRSIDLTAFLLKSSNKPLYHKKIKIYLTTFSKETDTLTFKVWYRHRRQSLIKNPLGDPNGYNENFSFLVPWDTASGWYRKLIIPFRTRYLVPVNIPFLYDWNIPGYEATFLNAGLAYGWAWGRTKFYKFNQMPPRSSYVGIGPFFNLSSALSGSPSKIDTNSVGKFVIGAHLGFNLASIQFMGIVGKYWDIDKTGGLVFRNKPIVGLGIGLSLFNFSVPTIASPPAGGH